MSAVLREIVSRTGGDIYAGGTRALIPGPGHSAKDRNLSLMMGAAGRVIWWSHAGDDASAVWAHLGLPDSGGRQMTPREAAKERGERKREADADRARKRRFCATIWAGTKPAAGSPVEAYLRGRGIGGRTPPVLRFHPAAPWGYPDSAKPLRTFPAMVAIATAPDGRTAAGLHVTALKPDGSAKASLNNARLMYGDLAGAAVQLGPLPEAGELGLAEGIETALSHRDLTGVVTWAALSTAGLRRFAPPAGLSRLVIAADGDDAGLAAARDLAERSSRRCECVVTSAPHGSDWNDVLLIGSSE